MPHSPILANLGNTSSVPACAAHACATVVLSKPRASQLILAMILLILSVGSVPPCLAMQLPAEEETAEEKRERITAERFLQLLERRPRQGTALDKVYGYHVARGSLDDFVEQLRTEATEPPNGNKWLVLGMVQMQRGQDALAAEALEKAEKLLASEPLASYYLGKTLVLLGEVDEAAAAMKRAIEKKPARPDMLQIFKDLGRVYQRTGRNQEALEIWGQLESLFPGDTGVQEQVAAILAEEGAEEAALERYSKLSKSTKDRFRRVEMSIRAAQLKAQLGQTEEALRDFESQLGVVNPESWLYRDIRRRIEEVFWAGSDFDGLVTYYTKWTEEHPDDVDAMLRTAHVLSLQKRSPEAQEWFRKAIKRAPTNVEARLSLVEALANDEKYAQAAEEMQALVEVEPDNPDYIVRWGELVLFDDEKPMPERQANASEIWSRMLSTRAEDPVAVSRVADLLRGADLSDAAIEQYQKAISLAENEPQYREYLGEYLHELNRKDEALEVWEKLASGDRKNRDNIVRLSEVLSTFGYQEKALAKMEEACGMKPTFGHRARYAELLRENQQYDAALAQLDLAEPLADDRELRELLITERIKNYQAAGTLKSKVEELEKAVAGDAAEDASSWRLLALLREANRNFQPACEAIEKATQIAGDDIQIWETAASLYERTGRFGEANAAYRKLATLDRRFLTNYLSQIASLEMRLGNIEAGLKAGEELLAAAPGNSEHYRFFAGLCMQAGQAERGLDALRRNVRSNPNDSDALNFLAKTLSDEFQTDEAIELYWRSFDIANNLEGKRPIVEALTELYLRTNRFEMLLDRLEIISREENKPRDGTLWTAAAHQAAGDLGMAKDLLEQLVRADSRDTRLLEQLVSLSKAEFDFETAAEYQKRLVSIAPSAEGDYLLATLLMELGELDEAEGLWQKLTSRRGRGGGDLLRSLNSLIAKDQIETADRLVERALQREPENWELLVPAMITSVRLDKMDKAKSLSDRALAMNVSLSAPTKQMQQQIKKMASQKNRPPGYDPAASLGLASTKMNVMSQVKSYLQPASNGYGVGVYGGMYGGSRVYTPNCFGDVQAVAEAVKILSIDNAEARKSFVTTVTDTALESNDAAALWQAMAYQSWELPNSSNQVSPDGSDSKLVQCLEKLVELKDPAAANMIFSREYSSRRQAARQANTKPLEAEEIDRFIKLAEVAKTQTGSGLPSSYRGWLIDELHQAGQSERANAMQEELLAEIKEPFELIQLASGLMSPLQQTTSVRSERAKEIVSSLVPVLKKALSDTEPKNRYVTYIMQSFPRMIPAICQYGEMSDAIEIIEAVLGLQARVTAAKRPSQRDKAGANPRMNYTYYKAGRYQRETVEFPPPSGYFDAPAITSLHALFRNAENLGKLDEVVTAIEAWNKADSDDAFLKFVFLLAKSSVEYWSGQQKAAVATIESAQDVSLGTQFVSLMQARVEYDTGDVRGALATVEALRPSNQRMLVDRELTLLQLVLQLGDLERAKKSAQKLFALRLDSNTEFKLADLMYQLGMREMGERMMGRIRRRAGGKQDTLVQLMQRYSTAGELDAAAEIARQVVRRTSPKVSSNYQTTENVQHGQALQVLVRAKAIQPMIERYETLVERSPKSMKLANQLAAFYEAAGRRADAQKLRLKAADSTPSDPRSLLATAQQLHASGATDKAVEKYIEAVCKSPDLLSNDFYQMRDAFTKNNDFPKLVDAMAKEGMAKFCRSNYRMGEIGSALVRAKQFDAAKKLYKEVLKHGDAYTIQYLMTQSRETEELAGDKELSKLIADKICGDSMRTGNMNYVQSRSSGGVGTGFANYLVKFLTPHPDQKSRVEQELKKRLKENKDDLFSRVVLSLLYGEGENYDQLAQLIEPLCETVEGQPNYPQGEARWAIASQLVGKEQAPELAIKILCNKDGAFNPDEFQNNSDFNYGVTALIISAYENAGQKEAASKLLVGAIDTIKIDETQSQYNPGYGEYQYIRSMESLALRLVAAESPAEAYIAYQRAFGDKKMLEASSRWGGGDYTARADRLLKSIEKKMTTEVVVDLVETATKSSQAEATQSANFLTDASEIGDSIAEARVVIPLEQFVERADEDSKLNDAIKNWLDQADLSPTDELRPMVIRLVVAHAVDNDTVTNATASALAEWLANHPASTKPPSETPSDSPEPAGDEKSSSIVEQELMLAIAARYLPDDQAGELGATLIQRAIVAAESLQKENLAFGLKCQLASQIAQHDKVEAGQLFMQALDTLLPTQKTQN